MKGYGGSGGEEKKMRLQIKMTTKQKQTCRKTKKKYVQYIYLYI